MLKSKLPIYCSGLAMALIAGAFSAIPAAHAQSYDEYAYSRDADDDDFTASDVDNSVSDDDAAAAVDDDDGGDDDVTVMANGSGEQRCAAQFRSFDPSSGTYMTYDGDRVPCPYL